jgi:hypothetical protein
MSRRPGDLLVHDPNAIEPQGFDWTDWLAELGASVVISDSDWTVSTIVGDAAPLTLSGATIVTGDRLTHITLTAGTPGLRYTVTNHITTSTGVEDDRSFKVLVVQR